MAAKRLLKLTWTNAHGAAYREATVGPREAVALISADGKEHKNWHRLLINFYQHPLFHLQWTAVRDAEKGVYVDIGARGKIVVTAMPAGKSPTAAMANKEEPT